MPLSCPTPERVVAHLQVQQHPGSLLRLLAVCNRRLWQVTAVRAVTSEDLMRVELHLTVRKGSAVGVHHHLEKLVDVLEVTARVQSAEAQHTAP